MSLAALLGVFLGVGLFVSSVIMSTGFENAGIFLSIASLLMVLGGTFHELSAPLCDSGVQGHLVDAEKAEIHARRAE